MLGDGLQGAVDWLIAAIALDEAVVSVTIAGPAYRIALLHQAVRQQL